MAAPTKAEYYGEDYSRMTLEEKLELSDQEGREAAGFLRDAYMHIGRDTEAGRLLSRLRDELIDEQIEGQKTDPNFKASGMTLFLYRALTAGIQPVTLGTGEVVNWFPGKSV